jgi:hypothetical protein
MALDGEGGQNEAHHTSKGRHSIHLQCGSSSRIRSSNLLFAIVRNSSMVVHTDGDVLFPLDSG